MIFKRERETKNNVVFKAVDDSDICGFSTLYIKKGSPYAMCEKLVLIVGMPAENKDGEK